MIWFTADQHFGHKGVLKYTGRDEFWSSTSAMDGELVSNWNSVVHPKDTVYVLGDFTLNGKEFAIDMFSQLNGQIIVVTDPKHHDQNWIKAIEGTIGVDHFVQSRSGLYVKYAGQIAHLKYHGEEIIMAHHPMWSWHKSYYGSIHAYGHVHGKYVPILGRHYDVGVDSNYFHPVSIDKLMNKTRNMEYPLLLEEKPTDEHLSSIV